MNLHTLLATFVDDLAPDVMPYLPKADPPAQPLLKKQSSNVVALVEEKPQMDEQMFAEKRDRSDTIHNHMMQDENNGENAFLADMDTCKFCMGPFTQAEQEKGEVGMFQSSECFHMFHLPCFADMANKVLCTVNKQAKDFEFNEAKCATCNT
jgi:hypothetical protein